MSKKRISISIVILAFTMIGYTFGRTLDISNSQTNFATIVSDAQEVFAYDHTTLMSVPGTNQHDLQTADAKWDKIYKYTDGVREK